MYPCGGECFSGCKEWCEKVPNSVCVCSSAHRRLYGTTWALVNKTVNDEYFCSWQWMDTSLRDIEISREGYRVDLCLTSKRTDFQSGWPIYFSALPAFSACLLWAILRFLSKIVTHPHTLPTWMSICFLYHTNNVNHQTSSPLPLWSLRLWFIDWKCTSFLLWAWKHRRLQYCILPSFNYLHFLCAFVLLMIFLELSVTFRTITNSHSAYIFVGAGT